MNSKGEIVTEFSATRIDFDYELTIPGHEKHTGSGQVLVTGQPTNEAIQAAVNPYVNHKIMAFAKERGIGNDGVIQTSVKMTVTGSVKLSTEVKIQLR